MIKFVMKTILYEYVLDIAIVISYLLISNCHSDILNYNILI